MGALSVYLDTSVVVPLLLPDPFNRRAEAFLRANPSSVVISDFVAAEFASAAGRRIRTRVSSESEVRIAFANLDNWKRTSAEGAETTSADVHGAQAMLRRLDLALRTPDALNLAIAQRLGAELATFDVGMADCARALRIVVVAL
jgi:predicted nucleic acid-binding protein